MSGYELFAADFGSSPDRAWAAHDQNPYVAGEFIWSGWDYLGEPTPYYAARSSYFGIIDLTGFRKDRFYLYQSRWRPDLPLAHLLPHWSWPGREGEVTPVHLFTSGDEAELFVNGKSQGRRKKAPFEYRIRWDYVTWEPGELKAVTQSRERAAFNGLCLVVVKGKPKQPGQIVVRAESASLQRAAVTLKTSS